MNVAAGSLLGSVSHARIVVAKPRRAALSRVSRPTLVVAKLPYSSGENTPRKPSLQTSATNPAVSAAAAVETDLASVQEHLEKLYTLNEQGQLSLESGSLEALHEVEALLQDLEGLDMELTSALEIAREDLTDLTVRHAS